MPGEGWPAQLLPVRACCLATSQTFTAVPAALTRTPSAVGWNCSTSTWTGSGPSTSPGTEGRAWPGAGRRHSFTYGKEQVCEPRAAPTPGVVLGHGGCVSHVRKHGAIQPRITGCHQRRGCRGGAHGAGKLSSISSTVPHHPRPALLRQPSSRIASEGHSSRQGHWSTWEHTGAGVGRGTETLGYPSSARLWRAQGPWRGVAGTSSSSSSSPTHRPVS